jgi:hypothetical protein
MNIYAAFNHTHWAENAKPSKNAVITSTDVQQVKYAKNNAKFKTTVYFSDGFWFVTYKTNREQHMLSYTISTNKAEAERMATVAHSAAIAKLVKAGKLPADAGSASPAPGTAAGENAKKEASVPPGYWRCTCGRTNPGDKNTCFCGVKKFTVTRR